VSEADKGTSQGSGRNIWLMVIAVAVALIGGAAIYYYRGGFSGGGEEEVVKGDPDPAALAKPGPLPDIVIGNASAPNTIIEYASMTCPHCAQFQNEVFPLLKAKYIDTGRAKYILREFPLDNLAVAAFMLARCAGEDRYYPMVDGLFETQEAWVVRGPEGKDKLEQIARQAGFSKERFDKCLGDKALFDDVVKARARAHQRFGVDSTPTFFVDAKRMKGDHQLSDFDAAFAALGVDTSAPAGAPVTSKEPSAPVGAEGAQPSAEAPQPSAEAEPSVDTSQPSPVVPPQSEEPVPGSVESQQSGAETPEPSPEMPAPSAETAEPSVDSSQPSPVVPPQSESPVPGSLESQQSSPETPEPSATPAEPSAETPEPSADSSQPSPVVPPESESPVPGSVGNP
jgi:protein-disulfide isomerase